VLVSFVYVVACRLFALVLLLARSDRSKELELLVLRHELSILRRQARRPQLTEGDRLVLAALSRVMPRRSWQVFHVTPETLLRWHRGSWRAAGRTCTGGRYRATPARQHHERIRVGGVRPSPRQRALRPLLIDEEHPVLAPGVPHRHQHQLPPQPRMERMRYPDNTLLNDGIERSRRRSPTPPARASSPRSRTN
jgi:hypothetical protein